MKKIAVLILILLPILFLLIKPSSIGVVKNMVVGFFEKLDNKFICNNGACEQSKDKICKDDCVQTVSGGKFGGDLLWYGVNTDRTSQGALQTFSSTFKDLGLEIARFDVYWGKLEPEKGRYDWRIADKLVLAAQGKEILFTVYSTSEWGSKYNECRAKAEGELGVNLANRPPSSIPGNMRDYTAFLDAIVNRYKDRVKYWQIENEVYGASPRISGCPPANAFWLGTKEEYVELLKVGYNKIKEADSIATVFASSKAFAKGNSELSDFYKFVLDKGRSYSDVWDLHLYWNYTVDRQRINSLKSEMNRLGYLKPIWVTESGEIDIDYHETRGNNFISSFDGPRELKLQAEELVKRHTIDFSGGVEKVFSLRLTSYGDNELLKTNWNHMGFTFDAAGIQKKPAYYTYKVLIQKLGGFSVVQKIADGQYKFTIDNKPVFVLWSDLGDKKVNLSSYISAPQVKITYLVTELDSENNPIYKKELINNTNSILLIETPIFVEGAQY